MINPGQLIEPNFKEEGVKDIQKVLQKAEEYLFSTHQEYTGKRGSIIIEKGVFGELLPTPEAYRQLVDAVLMDKKYFEIKHLYLE